MRIQYLNGGLANQVFQYIFYRYAQLEGDDSHTWYLDDSFFFFKNAHNGYELDKVFGLKPNLLSQQFDSDVWNAFIENRKNNIGTAQTMLNLGFPIKMISEASNYTRDNPFLGEVLTLPCNEYHPEILNVQGDFLYYFGYWINKNWFAKYKDLFLEELSFAPITDELNKSYENKIKSTLSVGIHIRCGDFITLGFAIKPDFYKTAVSQILDPYPDVTFFVFSDDIKWCEDHIEELGLSVSNEVVFVKGNSSIVNYIDMQLMSMCKGLIMSNSSFCYLSALLNTNLQFYINPLTYREL